ncbi:MAG: preprotein translocase subunit SecG [Candidatus Margulisiibacteriota bacterium]|nr:MAG: preprotein translocase subunit SecG [Candidatus Margulisbacteria bacterium GWD2_39_127]OGI02971.1 MAG: preprotein translocase subunit SecG [Candidatus Margulisbacteria bacterium GWF2_38_17]OGI09436.1 MAG: preprotein translocase subunit SecG [Candidatus Margulisbacteria bacterium GWE2_39_32]PZM78764.1 MAG: preprotein translocase subunit SecG [Candidatus Margulisiibacteriota bacterium]HAR63334.1 preprotein translocase subunit SecG [Candidatus Margulisiibacteriota bacterium]
MIYLLLTIEFVSAVLLTFAVLLHSAKGEGLGSIGGTARIFGTQKSLETGLNKVTLVLATLFLTSSALIYFLS